MDLFDANAHPTLSGLYLPDYVRNVPATIESYFKQAEESGREVTGACFSSLPGVDDGSPESWLAQQESEVRRSRIRAVYLRGVSRDILASNPANNLSLLTNLGYAGIKLHPRLAKWIPSAEETSLLANECAQSNLVLGVCGYVWDAGGKNSIRPFLSNLLQLTNEVPNLRIYVAHSDLETIRFALQLGISSSRVLFDTSLSLKRAPRTEFLRLASSALSTGLRLAFGSDWPDHALTDYESDLAELQGEVSARAMQDFLSRNSTSFFGPYFQTG